VGDQVLFLHKLQPGGADRSYGIEVGRLAGLPDAVIARARSVLRLLESEQIAPALGRGVALRPQSTPVDQLALFSSLPDPLVTRIAGIDPDHLTPLQALTTLADLVAQARTANQ
jgi:DNA mismatch repair protein MutS